MRALAIAVVVLGALAGCRQVFGFEDPIAISVDGPPLIDDAPVDATVDGPVDCKTFSTVIDTCSTTPTSALMLQGTYDTDTGVLTANSGMSTPQHVVFTTPTGELTAVFATSITVGSGDTIRFVGSRPVALVATVAINVTGTIDLTAGGAGADPTACTTERGGVGTNDGGGGSGGGGAGYQGAGGAGGNGDADSGQSVGGIAGNSRARALAPLGGCRGGSGGNGPGSAGVGGLGGGAILMVAGMSITIGSVINAGGGGGSGGTAPGGGGGGGGAGGMIILEASTVTVQAAGAVVANGGGGGEGAGAINQGMAGQKATATGSAATGGSGGSATGADGGNASGGGQLFGNPGAAVQIDGGGGGGGGAGFIAVRSQNGSLLGTVSPISQSWP